MNNKKYDICIVGGCGHVGLPLAIMFADKGQRVCVYDINRASIEKIKKGAMPFYEEGAGPILKRVLDSGRLTFSTTPDVIKDSSSVIIIIGTPVDEHLNPEFGLLKKTIDDLVPYLYNDQLLILRSTIYPGLTKRINDWITEAGKKLDVCFCPERILEGKAVEELQNLPQIVSSLSENGIKRCSELFSLLTDEIIVTEPLEAELSKLFTNVWRYLKFAISNQFYTIANDYNLDFYKIYNAMTYNYPRCKDFPRPGFAAGPCLFKDTMQLGAFSNNNFNLGHTAMLINEGLPNYICKQLKQNYDLSKMTVGILGMAFKSESDDIRESLSYKVKKIFELEARKVLCSDAYVKSDDFVEEDLLISESDIIIVATPHKRYAELSIPESKKVIDIWNVFGKGGRI